MKSFVALGWLMVCLIFSGTRAPAAETKHDFAKWEPEIAAFERSDATNPPPHGASLFIGSSTIRRWHTLAADFPGQQVINRGFGGSEIADSTHFASRIVFPYAPRLIFLRAGGNDIAAGKSVKEVFTDFKDFVATVQARLPNTEIIYLSISPTILRWPLHKKEQALNDRIRKFVAGKPHLHLIDDAALALGADGRPRPDLFVSDGLHFNAAGYQLLAECVRSQWPR